MRGQSTKKVTEKVPQPPHRYCLRSQARQNIVTSGIGSQEESSSSVSHQSAAVPPVPTTTSTLSSNQGDQPLGRFRINQRWLTPREPSQNRATKSRLQRPTYPLLSDSSDSEESSGNKDQRQRQRQDGRDSFQLDADTYVSQRLDAIVQSLSQTRMGSS